MQVADPDPDTLRRLAVEGRAHPRVVSLYLDLDPSRFATGEARATEITSLVDEARREVDREDVDREVRLALRADVDRGRRFLAEELSAQGVHGIALFVGGGGKWLRAVGLPRPPERLAIVDAQPWLEPLARQVTGERIAVLLASRRQARVLLGDRDHLEEALDLSDDVHGRVRGEGPAADRIQRSVDEDALDHLRRTATALFRRFKRDPFDALYLGATGELRPRVEHELHDYLRRRVRGHIEVEVEDATPDGVARALRPLLEEGEAAREREALARLRAGLGRGERAAAGPEGVREALAQARVEILLYEPGKADVQDAIEAAVEQAAEILPVRHHPDLGPHGGIAAVLRY